MYNIQVHVSYEKQQYIKKMNHYITTYPCCFNEGGRRDRQTETGTERHRETEIDRDRQRQRERTERGAETERDPNPFEETSLYWEWRSFTKLLSDCLPSIAGRGE